MNIIIKSIIFILLTYLIGGIPFAYIITKFFLKKDIRTIGSGNVGATNVYRAGGVKTALPVFILDFLKGFIPSLLAVTVFFKEYPIICVIIAIASVMGHILTPYLKFQGGKGAATSFGAFIVVFPIPILICLIIFIVIVKLSRIVALGTIVSAICLPLVYFLSEYVLKLSIPFEYNVYIFILMSVISLFIIYKHKNNIMRLFKGMENRI